LRIGSHLYRSWSGPIFLKVSPSGIKAIVLFWKARTYHCSFPIHLVDLDSS
jgi:hypothetical protein